MWMVHSGNCGFLALTELFQRQQTPTSPSHISASQISMCFMTTTTGAFAPGAAMDSLRTIIVPQLGTLSQLCACKWIEGCISVIILHQKNCICLQCRWLSAANQGTRPGLCKQCGQWRMSSCQCDFPCDGVYANTKLRQCRQRCTLANAKVERMLTVAERDTSSSSIQPPLTSLLNEKNHEAHRAKVTSFYLLFKLATAS